MKKVLYIIFIRYFLLLLSLSGSDTQKDLYTYEPKYEYIYPVGYLSDNLEEKLYILYQKSIHHIELWTWNIHTKVVEKVLLSIFFPASFTMLPDQSGFSFIDNGKIKINYFNKRSPKSIDIYESIYDMTLINWIDNFACYFSAKEHEHYAIYQVNIHGELERLVFDRQYDCMYPQKIENKLFYIKRGLGAYSIVQAEYPVITYDPNNTFNNTENFEERVAALMKKESQSQRSGLVDINECTPIVDFESEPIMFLRMISIDTGYVIQYPVSIDAQDKTIRFSYYQIKKDLNKKNWNKKELFTFELPSHLLLPQSSSCLYESILPLIPRHIDSDIYFMDCCSYKNLHLNLYRYSLDDLRLYKCPGFVTGQDNFPHNFCFAPIKVGSQIIYGGSMAYMTPDDGPVKKITQEITAPLLWVDQLGRTHLELPFIFKQNLTAK